MKKIKKVDLDKARLYAENGDYPRAIEIFISLLAQNPKQPEISLYLGTAYLLSSEYHKALEVLYESLKNKPDTPLFHHAIGSALYMLEEYKDALVHFDKEISINPYYPEAYFDKSKALYKLKKWEDALVSASIALDLDENLDDARLSKASSLNQLDRFYESYDEIKKIKDIKSMGLHYFLTLSSIYSNLGEKTQALAAVNKAIELKPDEKDALFNKALLLLGRCQFKEGWPLYEYRPYNPIDKFIANDFRSKLLKDNNDSDHVLIIKEQGVGDQILFSSLLFEFDLKRINFYVEIDQRLMPIFERSYSGIKFIGSKKDLREDLITLEVAMGSLPGLTREDINLFKNQKNSFLKSDPIKTNFIKNKIKKNGFKICGISWKSSNDGIGFSKTIELSKLENLLQTPNILFVNIQYGVNSLELINFCNHFNLKILSFDDLDIYNDLDSLFSLIDACDFVITISNINAHIAGALGKKTFLLAPFSKGRIWYWHDSLEHSLWYPSIQIFTQTKTGDWSVPINQIKEKIVEEIAHE
jgi:tetratricopeptide (TPR) repeat protein